MPEDLIDSTPADTQPAAPVSGDPSQPAGGATAVTPQPSQAKQYTYPEDRSNWVPSHRIRETQEQAARRIAETEARAEQLQRQVQALTGVQPSPRPVDPQTQAIQQQLLEVFPNLRYLTDEKFIQAVQAYQQALEQGFDPTALRESSDYQLELVGMSALNMVMAEASKVLGDLTPMMKRTLAQNFAQFVNESSQNTERYARQDPGLIGDFIKEVQTGFVEPLRRKFTVAPVAQQPPRRGLPRGGGGQVPPVPSQKPRKPGNLDEANDAAWAAFQANQY